MKRPPMTTEQRAKRAAKRERRNKERAMAKGNDHPLWAEVTFTFFDEGEPEIAFKNVACIPSPPFFQVISPNGEMTLLPLSIVKRVDMVPSMVDQSTPLAAVPPPGS